MFGSGRKIAVENEIVYIKRGITTAAIPQFYLYRFLKPSLIL